MRAAEAVAVIIALIALVVAVAIMVRRPSSSAEERRILNAHTKLTLLAARASRKGFSGEANIYQESADRLLEAWNHGDEDDD